MPFTKGHKINVGRKHSEELKTQASIRLKGKPFSGGKHSPWKGKKLSAEHKRKVSEAVKKTMSDPEFRKKMSEARKGEKGYWWRGGITPINAKIRNGLEYRMWREAVFIRDDYTCVWCLKRGVKLNADHIKPFALYPELRFAIDNGRTLCEECHKTTDTFKGKTRTKKL